LLDVNALIALAWDDHEHFEAAHRWFADHSREGFASCHVTQSGFIRLSINPRIIPRPVEIAEILAKLKSFILHPSHKFFEDGPVEINSPAWTMVTGHNQVTDLNLLLIARRNGAKLATFEASIRNRLRPQEQPSVEVIPI